MPSLGADMDDGILIEWLKHPGDAVHRGDIIAVVETQKGAIEIEVFEDGQLTELKVTEGECVPVGAVLALIDGPALEPVAAPEPAPVSVRPEPQPAAPMPPRNGRTKVSPVARRRAAALGIDPSGLAGTGPGGAVTLADVESVASAAPKAAPRRTAFDPTEMRRAIAAAMERSKREIPHFYLAATADMSNMLDWIERENAMRPVLGRLLAIAPLLKAVALALRATPDLNGHWIDGAFRPAESIHLGNAVSLRGGGLVAPAIRDIDKRDLDDLMRTLRDVVARARKGALRSSELSDSTVTVTSLGDDGAEVVYPVIYPPQVAMIGFGAVVERPWPVDGAIDLRRVQTVTLAADHRVVDGRRGSRFLKTLNDLLQEPEKL